ncbi:hypothetical protein ACJIZ3_022577 [Penstemon smallii]|uniref:Uncharacterized protein n=1 Tax=Penstemon smallii TaxID=265156 RepID=A0ABD3TMZ5_9LAMI
MIMRRRYMEPLTDEIKPENASFIKSQVLGSKEKDILCSYKQEEISESSNHAMEFLCRSWSPSASDFLQIFSSKKHLLPSDTKHDENLTRADSTQTSTIQQDYNKMELNYPKTWLRDKSLTGIIRSRKERKKEETRLRTAELHTALSLTTLAAAIAGFSGSIATQEKPGAYDMGNVLSSAAALVTTACAEVAESLGAKRAQVRAAVDSGMAIQTPIDMIAVTAMAATCLRGSSLLKSRAMVEPVSRIPDMLKVGAQIYIIMPSGRKECARVSVYIKHDHLKFVFRRKYFGGALTSAKEYKVTNIMEERSEHQEKYFLCLKTKNGIMKLLFEDETQSRIWIPTIFNLLGMCNPCWEATPSHHSFQSSNSK